MDRFVLSALVHNHPGVLFRVAGLFCRRDFNIDGITAGETSDPSVTRMTIEVSGDEHSVEQIRRQLEKLEDVIAAKRLRLEAAVTRELALVKLAARGEAKGRAEAVASRYGARVADACAETITFELSAPSSMVDAFMAELAPFGETESARTGLGALERGAAFLSPRAAVAYRDRAPARGAGDSTIAAEVGA